MNFNFELILFYATVVTGLITLFDIVFLAARRRVHAEKNASTARLPILIEYARSFFPILLIVFLLRSFLFEPFRIPSGSLEPTLLIGDFILLNKFDYGIRLPIVRKKIIELNEPKRGDIIVFHWPPNPSYYFIKRVIGLPGDRIDYVNKELTINGQKIPQELLQKSMVEDTMGAWEALEKQENLFNIQHKIYLDPAKSSRDFYNIIVPPGMYFVMGDNRDDSADSRYWGFVPEKNIAGKAVLTWMSWDSHATRVRWNRIGRLIN